MKIKDYLLMYLMFTILTSCVGTDFISDPESETRDGQLKIQAPSLSVMVDETIQFLVEAYDASENLVESPAVNWTSSNNNIFSITNDGSGNGLQKGQTTIIASAEGFKSDSTILTIVENFQDLAVIRISPESADLSIGQSITFSAEGLNANGTAISGIQFQWLSSNPTIVSIDINGVATANAAGNSMITANAEGIQSQNILVEVAGVSKVGEFVKRPGSSYTVMGSVEVIHNGSNLVVNFGSDFITSNGPDLHVYISSSQSIGSGSIDLGQLKSASGVQSYDVPGLHSLDEFSWVIIHCVPFNVTFGYANLN